MQYFILDIIKDSVYISELKKLECTTEHIYFETVERDEPYINCTITGDTKKIKVNTNDLESKVLKKIVYNIGYNRRVKQPHIVKPEMLGLKQELSEYKYIVKAFPTLGYEEINNILYEYFILAPLPLRTSMSLYNPFLNCNDNYNRLGVSSGFYLCSQNPDNMLLKELNVNLYYKIRSLLLNLVPREKWKTKTVNEEKLNYFFKVTVFISNKQIKILKVQLRVDIHVLDSSTYHLCSFYSLKPSEKQLLYRNSSVTSISRKENGFFSGDENVFHSVGKNLRKYDHPLTEENKDMLQKLDNMNDYITTYRYYLDTDNPLEIIKKLFQNKEAKNTELIQLW